MKENHSEWSKLRSELMKEEEECLGEINKEAAKVKAQTQKSLKAFAVIGGSVLLGIMMYKWLKPSERKSNKRDPLEEKQADKKERLLPRCTTSSLASFALKKIAPMVLKSWLEHKKR